MTYIQDHIDPNFQTFIATPPFPEYTSGHSSQSGAATVVLADFFGQQFAFTDRTRTTHGLTPDLGDRSFGSFQEAGEEAAVSRLFGGIHYRFGNEEGLTSGRCIGQTLLDDIDIKKNSKD